MLSPGSLRSRCVEQPLHIHLGKWTLSRAGIHCLVACHIGIMQSCLSLYSAPRAGPGALATGLRCVNNSLQATRSSSCFVQLRLERHFFVRLQYIPALPTRVFDRHDPTIVRSIQMAQSQVSDHSIHRVCKHSGRDECGTKFLILPSPHRGLEEHSTQKSTQQAPAPIFGSGVFYTGHHHLNQFALV